MDKKSLKTAYKLTMRELRENKNFPVKAIAFYFNVNPRKIYNYEYSNYNSLILSALYFLTFIKSDEKAVTDLITTKSTTLQKVNYIAKYTEHLIYTNDKSVPLNNIADFYNVPTCLLSLFYEGILDDEYPFIILIHFYFLGGYEQWQRQIKNFSN